MIPYLYIKKKNWLHACFQIFQIPVLSMLFIYIVVGQHPINLLAPQANTVNVISLLEAMHGINCFHIKF